MKCLRETFLEARAAILADLDRMEAVVDNIEALQDPAVLVAVTGNFERIMNTVAEGMRQRRASVERKISDCIVNEFVAAAQNRDSGRILEMIANGLDVNLANGTSRSSPLEWIVINFAEDRVAEDRVAEVGVDEACAGLATLIECGAHVTDDALKNAAPAVSAFLEAAILRKAVTNVQVDAAKIKRNSL